MLTVPYGAGSTTDIFARVVGEALSVELKQPVVVDNRPGAGGSMGIGQALRAPADGYTLMLVTTSSIAINGTLYNNLPYDPAKDVTIVSIVSSTANALVVPASLKVDTYKDFEKRMKDGAQHFYNSQGAGTTQHLSAVLLTQQAGLRTEHVPYRGQEGITGMLGGQTEFAFASLPSVLTLANSGKLKVLAVTGSKPSSALPNVPTLASLAYKAFATSDVWYGIGVNSNTPTPIKEKLAQGLAKVSAQPQLREKLARTGFEPMAPMSDAARQAFVESQVKVWSALVKESGAKAD
ncbi:Bug family tripartite tricarboxylate transporter substrate binding protein [Cupriavidus basilensis]